MEKSKTGDDKWDKAWEEGLKSDSISKLKKSFRGFVSAYSFISLALREKRPRETAHTLIDRWHERVKDSHNEEWKSLESDEPLVQLFGNLFKAKDMLNRQDESLDIVTKSLKKLADKLPEEHDPDFSILDI